MAETKALIVPSAENTYNAMMIAIHIEFASDPSFLLQPQINKILRAAKKGIYESFGTPAL